MKDTSKSALKCIFALLLILLTGIGSPTAACAEDLLEVCRQAASTNPILKKARAQLQAEKASGSAARGELYPKVNAGAGVSLYHTDMSGFPPLTVDEGYTAANYSVTLIQPVVNGQNWTSVKASDSRIGAAEKGVLAAEQDLILRVSEAYFGVLQARADERVAVGQRDLLKKILDQAEAFLRVGTGDIVSVREARARFDGADSDLINARNSVRIAEQALIRLTHSPVGELDDLGNIRPEGPVPDEIAPWIKMAFENQPLLLQAQKQLRVSQDQVEIARRARWPRINLEAGYGYAKGQLLPELKRTDIWAGLALVVPIYEGGEISAGIREAEALASASRYSVEDIRDQIRFETESSFLTLKDSVAQLDAATEAEESARVSMEAMKKGYEVGTHSITDLLDSIQNYTNMRRNKLIALYNHVLARIRLKKAVGVVNIKDVEDVNTLLTVRPRKDANKGKEEVR
ncbi:MAG: TolC family outer membrane protein [Desulfobacteraceae bacterium]|nr:TolC family outer membrane protein [Desulfobacteraceae bacterium]